MGDLSCGCGRSNDCNNCNSCNNNNRGILGNNSCIWIILLLLFCGGDDCGCGLNGILGNNNNNNGCCDLIIWIILLSFLCGNNCG